MKNTFKTFLFTIFVIIFVQLFWLVSFYFFADSSVKHPIPQKKATLHVFIHGTFGSSLGLLSFFSVVHDNFKGSHYIKTTRLMRKDPFFYKDQPMLERGLVEVSPSYAFCPTEYQKIAQALIKSYAEINQFAKPHHSSQQFFYTFGWSGLLSKKQRREEAVRLYNALSLKKKEFEDRGYKTKIILAAHSHGGNLALNLAGINNLLFPLEKGYESSSLTHLEEQKKLAAFLEKLPFFEEAINKKGEKQFDYKPEGPKLSIDRLYLLGTPIQPETDCYALDQATFKRVYNIYSDNDPIQKIDWVSTSRYYSDQRFASSLFAQKQFPSHVNQVRIIFDKNQKPKEKQKSWFSALFFKQDDDFAVDEDPSHRDLWFISHLKKEEDQTILYPLPLFVFCPLIHGLIKQRNEHDFDININRMHRHIRLSAYHHGSDQLLRSEFYPLAYLQKMKQEVSIWQPHPLIKQNEFAIISAHVKKAALKK